MSALRSDRIALMCWGLLFFLRLLSAEAAGTDQILFVHVRWESNQVSILKVDARPGRFKEASPAGGALQVRLADAQGQVLWACPLADSRLRSLEIPADSAHGFARMTVTQSTAEAVVRVPMKAGAHELAVLGEVPGKAVAQKGSAKAASDVTPERPVLARFVIQPTASAPTNP